MLSLLNLQLQRQLTKGKKPVKRELVCKRVRELQEMPQHAQRTPSWYKVRQTMVTASEAASALFKTSEVCRRYMTDFQLIPYDFEVNPNKGCNPYASYRDFILRKCGRGEPFTGNIATRWGQKLEDVAAGIYSNLTGKRILEFGLIQHPHEYWLGASPDGITPDGVMLEIKCPYRRKITGVPPFYYWIQCQIQMEVCNLDKCDFLECTFDPDFEKKSYEEFLAQPVCLPHLSEITDTRQRRPQMKNEVGFDKGMIIQLIPNVPEAYIHTRYIYPPIGKLNCKQWIDERIKQERAALAIQHAWYKSKGKIMPFVTVKPLYWKLTDVHITTINRDPKWFETVKPMLFKAQQFISQLKEQPEKLNTFENSLVRTKNTKRSPKLVSQTPFLCGDDSD